MNRLEFVITQEPTPSVQQLRTRLADGGPTVLTGDLGSGRTTAALTAAGEQAIYLSFGARLDRTPYAMVHAARQLGRPEIVRAYANQGLSAALTVLDDAAGPRAIVLDDADVLIPAASALHAGLDDVPGMLQPADGAWWAWFTGRKAPTLLVTGPLPPDPPMAAILHQRPARWPVKLRYAEEGMRDWRALAHRLDENPDALYFARVVAPMMSADEFNALVQWSDVPVLSELGKIFRSRGDARVAALDLAAAMEGAPPALVRRAIAEASPRNDGDPLAWLEDLDQLFERLVNSRLLVIHGDQVYVSGVALRSGAVQPLLPTRASAIARRLLRSVNHPASLQPDDAITILAAHRLAVEARDRDLALQTAHLHGQGLIELARELSQADDFHSAWEVYGHVLQMLNRPPAVDDPLLQRPRSYALNYHAWNGRRSSRMDDAAALAEVELAAHLWPENARWQGHRVALQLRLGRIADALGALDEAEATVPDHPQRARHLRVYPALECLSAGRVRLAMSLLRIDARPRGWEDDDQAVDRVRGACSRLEHHGAETDTLDAPSWRLVFNRKLVLKLAWTSGVRRWTAQVEALQALCTGATVDEALDGLADGLAQELRRLVGTPTPWLSDADAARKSTLIELINVLESDFGLAAPRDRWLVGRVEREHLVIMDPRLGDRVAIRPEALQGKEHLSSGLWYGRVSVDRAGAPLGEVEELQPAGAGRSADEIQRYFRELWGDAP